MKKTFLALLLLTTVALITNSLVGVFPVFADKGCACDSVTVYYFHGNFRCATCNKMERYSKEAVEKNFKDALDSKKLVFKAVNVESKNNEHYVTDYQLYTKALVLSMEKNGKEIRHKNLDKIWEYVRNKDQFVNYVRDEVAAFLKET